MMWVQAIVLLALLLLIVINSLALRDLGRRMDALEKEVGEELSAIIARLEQALAKALE